MNVLNICPHCSKERVSDGDWPSCKACESILADYPAIDQIENDQARKVVMEAFQLAQKMRCDFLQGLVWVGAGPKVKDVPRIDSNGLLVMPSWMTLRPKAMIAIENDLVDLAMNQKGKDIRYVKALSDIDLNYMAKIYVSRFEAFLLNQRKTEEQLAAFQKGDIDQLITALELSLMAVTDRESPRSRERSIVATKIEEALLWAKQVKSIENFEAQKRDQGFKEGR